MHPLQIKMTSTSTNAVVSKAFGYHRLRLWNYCVPRAWARRIAWALDCTWDGSGASINLGQSMGGKGRHGGEKLARPGFFRHGGVQCKLAVELAVGTIVAIQNEDSKRHVWNFSAEQVGQKRRSTSRVWSHPTCEILHAAGDCARTVGPFDVNQPSPNPSLPFPALSK